MSTTGLSLHYCLRTQGFRDDWAEVCVCVCGLGVSRYSQLRLMFSSPISALWGSPGHSWLLPKASTLSHTQAPENFSSPWFQAQLKVPHLRLWGETSRDEQTLAVLVK